MKYKHFSVKVILFAFFVFLLALACPVSSYAGSSKKVRIAVADLKATNDNAVIKLFSSCGAAVKKVSSAGINVNKYDGLVIPGGGDINPKWYGEKNTASKGINNRRDKLQIKLVKKFAAAGKPVFGICRGCQIINVAFGGSLFQDIGSAHLYKSRKIKNIKGTVMYRLYGRTIKVKHYHHQAVKVLAPGFSVMSRDKKDGNVEGIYNEPAKIYGVQWHPEMEGKNGKKIAKWFVKLCRKSAAAS